MAKAGTELRRYLERELKKDIRKRYSARIAELRAQARAAKAERKERLKRARAACKERRAAAVAAAERKFKAELKRDRDRQKAATVKRNEQRRARIAEAAERCRLDEQHIRDEAAAKVAEARELEREERRFRREMEGGAKALRKARVRQRGGSKGRAVARSESDDRVRQNIPAHLRPVFDRVRRQIKGSPRISRTEAFLEWVHGHPEVVAEQLAEVPTDAQYSAEEAAWYAQQGGRVDEADLLEEVPF